jgi:hypothetical protein
MDCGLPIVDRRLVGMTIVDWQLIPDGHGCSANRNQPFRNRQSPVNPQSTIRSRNHSTTLFASTCRMTYFDAFRITIDDHAGAAYVAVVNERFGRLLQQRCLDSRAPRI